MVEQETHKLLVGSSNLPLGTTVSPYEPHAANTILDRLGNRPENVHFDKRNISYTA